MQLSGVSKKSIEEELQRINRKDIAFLLSFDESLGTSLATKREKDPMKVRKVIELFGFSSDYIDIGQQRGYQVPEMRLNLSTPSAHKLLNSIANV